MHESAPSGPPSAETIERGHESSIIGLRGFVIFLGILVATGVVVCLAMWGTLAGLQNLTSRKDPELSPLKMADASVKVPEPWLQPSKAQANPASEAQDLASLRAAEDAVLNSYGTDARTGAVRIPIARAMDMMVEGAGGATTRSSGGVR